MALKINLLPSEKRVSGNLGKFLAMTRMLGVIGIAVFLVFSLGVGAFFILSSTQLNNLNSENDSLKSQLVQLSTTEAQMVVLKDRVAKIKTIQSTPTAFKNMTDFLSLTNSFSNSSLNELDVDPTSVVAIINFKLNSDLSAFIQGISSSTLFKSVSLDSFSFNPGTGYLANLSAKSNNK